jgi:hypothetical protein
MATAGLQETGQLRAMAQPIPLHRTERKDEQADAIHAALELLRELHDKGLLDLARGIVAASPEIVTWLSTAANTPEGIVYIRRLVTALKIFRRAATGLAQSRAILHGLRVFGQVLVSKQTGRR